MDKIIIGFSKGKGFVPISWAIKCFEGTPYSHAYVKIEARSYDRTLVYEATGKGIYFKSLEDFNKRSEVIAEYEIEINLEQKKNLMQFCIDNSGKHYGKLQIVSILIKKSLEKLGIKIQNLFPNATNEFICSELAAKCLEVINLKVADDLDLISPKDLHEYLEKIAKKVN